VAAEAVAQPELAQAPVTQQPNRGIQNTRIQGSQRSKGEQPIAEGRRTDPRAYTWSRYGPVEPFFLTIEIRFPSGKLLTKQEVSHDCGTGVLHERAARALCMCKSRFKLCYHDKEVLFEYGATMFTLLKGER